MSCRVIRPWSAPPGLPAAYVIPDAMTHSRCGTPRTCSEADTEPKGHTRCDYRLCGNPAIPTMFRDRWLCVPALRQVCHSIDDFSLTPFGDTSRPKCPHFYGVTRFRIIYKNLSNMT